MKAQPQTDDATLKKHPQLEKSLRRQIDFDAVVARALARFVSCSAADVDGGIEITLKELARFAGMDAACVILRVPDGAGWRVSHRWGAEGAPDYGSADQEMPVGPHPWMEAKVLAGETVSISSTADLPPEAEALRHYLERDGVYSQFVQPLQGRDGLVTGCVVFRSYEHQVNWMPAEFPGAELVYGAIARVLERKQCEDMLREADSRYRVILEQVHDAFFSHDFQGHIVDLNENACRLSGYSRAELIAGSLQLVLTPQERKRMPERLAQLKTEGVLDFDGSLVRKGGTHLPASCTARLVSHAGNGLIQSFVRDMSEHKRTEEALLQSEERYRQLVNTMEDIVHSVGVDGTILFVGPQVERYGYTAEELISKPFVDFILAEDRESVLHDFQRTMTTGEEMPTMFRILTKDGRVVWFEELSRVVRDNDGNIVSISGMLRDVTERERVERERAEALSRFSGFAEASQYGMGMATLDGHIVYANPTLVRMLGEQSSDDCLGKHFPTAYYPPSVGQIIEKDIMPTLMEKGHWHGELELQDARGRRLPTDENYFVIRDENGRSRYLADILTDITERRQAEERRAHLESQVQQAQKMEAVGRLAGGVAHDFNNLLMGIMNYVDLCRDGVDADHPIRQWLDEITIEAKRSANIVRQLLAFARKQDVAPRVLDLNEAVAGMLKLLRRLLGEDIDLVWMPGAGLWPVMMDPGQIDQLVANLCVNARDAISGPGRLTLETKNVTMDADHESMYIQVEPGDYVVLSVNDTGCGMDEHTLAHILEPFFTTKEVGMGTGMGLATVHGVVKQCGGGLDVDSRPGSGSTFRVYLPKAVEDKENDENNDDGHTELLHGTETVLLVEDEKSPRVTCQLFLEALGYTVLTAERPEKALQLAREYSGQIHLLVTDMIMPGMTGHDLADRLTSSRPGLKCLFISGYTADVLTERVTQETDMAFMSKPFTRDQFSREVRRILDV